MLKISLILLMVCACLVSGRILTADQFSQELRRNGIAEWMIPTFVCIAQYESHYDTSARNWNSGDHGIFQISQLYWCFPNGSGCGMSCDSLRDDDITNDIKCAMIVYDETQRLSGNGFTAWTTYQYCR